MSKVNLTTRPAANVKLSDFCVFANINDFLEVTEWSNCEGVDINIETKTKSINFRLTFGELKAINKCVKAIQNDTN